MKKLLSMVILFVVIFSVGSISVNAAPKQKAKAKAEPSYSKEITDLSNKVKENNDKIRKLMFTAEVAYQKAKVKIAKKMAEMKAMTKDRAEALKDIINAINEDDRLIDVYNWQIINISSVIDVAEKRNDLDKIKKNLNILIDVQQCEIKALNKIIDDINKIEKI